MSENVSFIQGSKENYNSSEMAGGVFFSKDTKEILLNGESYGNAVKSDEEDITSDNNLLKLKNRSALNGMGYVILRKNKSFAEQVTNDHTIYEIRYEFNLCGAEVTIPKGCVLKFEGGKIYNGTLKGNFTDVNAGIIQVFNNIKFTGNWIVKESYPEWFGAYGDFIHDDTQSLIAAFSAVELSRRIVLSNRYLITPDTIKIGKDCVIDGKGVGFIGTKSSSAYLWIIRIEQYSEKGQIIIENCTFSQMSDTYNIPTGSTNIDNRLINVVRSNTIIRNNVFYNYSVAVGGASGEKGIVVQGNKIFFSRRSNVQYDISSIYIDSYEHSIINNYIDGGYGITGTDTYANGGLESHGNCYIVKNNYIKRCIVAINLVGVGFTYESKNIYETAIVTNNRITECVNGIDIWSTPTQPTTSNIIITNNAIQIGTKDESVKLKGYIGSGILFNRNAKAVKNVLISNNSIFYDLTLGFAKNPIVDAGYGLGAIYTNNEEFSDIEIVNNTIESCPYPAIHFVPSTQGKNVKIQNNTFKHCEQNILSSLNHYDTFNSTITLKNVERVNIIGNITTYTTVLTFGGYFLNCIEGCSDITVKENKFYGETILHNSNPTCKFNDNKYKIDIPVYSIERLNGNPNVDITPRIVNIDNGIPKEQFHIGDVFVKNGKRFTLKDEYNGKGFSTVYGVYTNTDRPNMIETTKDSDLNNVEVGDTLLVRGTYRCVVKALAGRFIIFLEDIPNVQTSTTWFAPYIHTITDDNGIPMDTPTSGTFAQKPSITIIGFQYFNTDTNRMITWDGTDWRNSDGTIATD